MPETKKNTLVKAPQKPQVTLPPRPNIPQFKKPVFNTPKFSSNFRINQNRGSGGK